MSYPDDISLVHIDIIRHLPETYADFRRNVWTVGRFFDQDFSSFLVHGFTWYIWHFYVELGVKFDH